MSAMENMLLDDSSSGESDDEVDVPTGRSVAAAIATAPLAAAPKPAPVAAPRPAPVQPQQSEEDKQKERLKNLYRTQNMRPQTSSAPMQPPPSLSGSSPNPLTGPPMNPRPGMSHPSNAPPNSSRSRAYAPPQQQPKPTTQSIPQPPAMNVSRSSQPRSQPQMQQRSQMPSQQTQYNPHSRSSHGSHPSQSSRSHAQSQASRSSSHSSPHDPYASSQYKSREQQRQPSMSSHSARPSTSSYPSTKSTSTSAPTQSSSSSGRQLTAQEQAIHAARRKRQYTLFTQVLLKRLEKEKPKLHRAAKATIQECAIRNKQKQPGYESLTNALMPRLKRLVGDEFWSMTQRVLQHHMAKHKGTDAIKQQQKKQQQQAQQRQAQQQLERQKQLQRQQQAQAQHAQRQTQHRQQQQQQQQQTATPNLSRLQQEVSSRKTEIARTTPGSVAAAKGSSAQKKPAVAKARNRGTSPAPASRKPGTPVTAAVPAVSAAEEPPKEYKEFMQMVDHAVSYDYKTAGRLIKANKTDLHVDDEQKRLLGYGSVTLKRLPPQTQGPRPGWDKTNVFSARAAWARVRLPEQSAAKETTRQSFPGERASSWTHEQKAEQDVVLAMLSEGCQHYLRDILKRAVHCSRERQNIDGIRLWHQQHVSAGQGKENPLSLRLGCDVSRQVAQVAGNSALTCKRMEEALERKSGVPAGARVLNNSTLEEATSMGDLSLRPQLAKGPASADLQAKRDFEEYGGRHASEPPLGRVPKKAKVETIDLVHGQTLLHTMGHRAVTSKVSSY